MRLCAAPSWEGSEGPHVCWMTNASGGITARPWRPGPERWLWQFGGTGLWVRRGRPGRTRAQTELGLAAKLGPNEAVWIPYPEKRRLAVVHRLLRELPSPHVAQVLKAGSQVEDGSMGVKWAHLTRSRTPLPADPAIHRGGSHVKPSASCLQDPVPRV